MIVATERYTARQVADLVFGKRLEWFYANRRRLEKLDGFPRPISPRGQPRWFGGDLLAWMGREKAREGQPAPRGPRGPNVVELRERAQALAAGR